MKDTQVHKIGDVFKDNWDSKYPWRVQMPKGKFPTKTKREAERISESMTHGVPACDHGDYSCTCH